VVMHAIRRAPEKRYRSMEDMLYDLRNLDSVAPVPYKPESGQKSGLLRQIIVLALIILAVCLVIIAFGLLAQLAHR
jgi:hypothetical protein